MNKLFSLVLIIAILTGCTPEKKQDPFEISKQHIGLLTDSTQVKDLKLVFPNDSIIQSIKGDEFADGSSDIVVQDKTGKDLLLLSPYQELDSTSTIQTVQVLDSRFKTGNNITNLSTFADIQKAYKISKINTLLNSVVIDVKEINASFTIDKKELPSNLRYNVDLKIEAVQIPDKAKIKYFIIHW